MECSPFVVLRNGAPDLATFAVLTFPDSSLKAPEGHAGRAHGARPARCLWRRHRLQGRDGQGARIVFKYARHFEAPNAAEEKFGSATAFEHDLAIGRLNDDGTILLLPTRRPNQDNLSAPIRGNGSYVVAGPK